MPYGTSIIDSPYSKGHKIERRKFTFRTDLDFANMVKAVPFIIGGEPVARVWWQQTSNGSTALCTGCPAKKAEDRLIVSPMGSVRTFVPGDAPDMLDMLIEVRPYNNSTIKEKQYKVRPPNRIPGFDCFAWWEVDDADKPTEGEATLCTGLRPVSGAEALKVPEGDDLTRRTKAELMTIAVREGIRDLNDSMMDGEISSRIRAHRAAKADKKTAGKLPKQSPTV